MGFFDRLFGHGKAEEVKSHQLPSDIVCKEFGEVGNRVDNPGESTASVNHDFETREVRYVRVESNGCKQNVFDSFSRLVEIQAFLTER